MKYGKCAGKKGERLAARKCPDLRGLGRRRFDAENALVREVAGMGAQAVMCHGEGSVLVYTGKEDITPPNQLLLSLATGRVGRAHIGKIAVARAQKRAKWSDGVIVLLFPKSTAGF